MNRRRFASVTRSTRLGKIAAAPPRVGRFGADSHRARWGRLRAWRRRRDPLVDVAEHSDSWQNAAREATCLGKMPWVLSEIRYSYGAQRAQSLPRKLYR
jgi:hypothetical protein